ncbi:hypothetical protein ACFW2K_02810 [Streptomyces nigra]|uniref:hypothetical protein n=1 Tax=Streptomyces nigra TaxID=1827580 RepID=UPI0036923196
MSAAHVLVAAAEGGVIGDGRSGANLALGVGLTGVAIGWLSLARIAGRISTGNARASRPSPSPPSWSASPTRTSPTATDQGAPHSSPVPGDVSIPGAVDAG